MRGDKRTSLKSETKGTIRGHKRGVAGYSRKTALLEEAITQMNAGKYGRSSAALKELLVLDPQNMEARRLFATLHLRLGSLIPARQAFDTLITEAFQRQDYWLAESLLREYLAAGPRCVPFLEKLGLIYQEKGDVLEAVAEYGKAIDILIEDPDPDHPQLVSQLYKRVRDLAPASPVAIRLASLFDAQTGEFLARESNRSDTVTESPVSSIDNSTVPEPAKGMMPWDIETSQGGQPSPRESVPQTDGVSPSTLAKDTDALQENATALGQGEQLGEVPTKVQSDRSMGSATPARPLELTRTDEDLGHLPTNEGDAASVGDSSQEAQSVAPPSDPAAEAQLGLQERDATGVETLPVMTQGSEEILQQAAHTSVACAPASSDVQTVAIDHSDLPREVTASTLETEPTTAGQSSGEGTLLPEAVLAVSDSAALTHAHAENKEDGSVAGVSGQSSTRSVTEPWKEPGFSWESLFDRAWNFGNLPPAKSVHLDTAQAKGETPPILKEPHQDNSPIESESVEIPDRAENAAAVEEMTSTASIKPMPWDTIQESVLPIPPAQVDEPHVGSTDTTEGQLASAAQNKPQVESEAVEIPDRAENAAAVEEMTSTASIKPMPWDEMQEAVISIPPAQVDEPHVGGTDTTETPSPSTVGLAETVELSPEQPLTANVAAAPLEQRGSLSGTQPTALPWDSVQESVIPIPPAQVDEPHAGGTDTTEAPSTSTVDSAETVEVSQDQSPSLAAVAPDSGETESLSVISSSSAPSFSESEVNPIQIPHSAPETPRLEVTLEFSRVESIADAARLKPHEATTIDPTSLHGELGDSTGDAIQTEESSQRLSLQSAKAQDVEQETAAPGPVSAQEFELISETLLSRDLLPSNADESDRMEVPTELVQEVRPPEECAPASIPLHESHTDIPLRKSSEPVSASPIEQEAIAALPLEVPVASPSSNMAEAVQRHNDQRQEDMAVAEPTPKRSESVVQQEEWAKTSDSIRFIEEAPVSSGASPVGAEMGAVSQSLSLEAVADDTRFISSRDVGRAVPREREVESPSRPKIHSEQRGIGTAIQEFIGSCFSTTRAIVTTCVGLILLTMSAVAVGIGLVGLTWVVMEEGPSPAYQSFTTIPQRTLSDFKKNGYFLLVGFDAPAQLDPIQVGHEGNIVAENVVMGRACFVTSHGTLASQTNASANVAGGWFRSADPIGQFKSHSNTVQGWVGQQASALSRYGRWHTLPFEDWGYGQTTGLPCASIIFAHELYLADGFLQTMEEGVERLETDMEAWRIVLGQARTLSVKTLALQAMNDDIAVASGLLVRSDFDGKNLGRLTKMLRPLDQAELSLRWPMQSELLSASKSYEARLKSAKAEDQSVYAVITSILSLPKQRRLNDYAEYYEASYKAVGEGHHTTLPKWKDYIRTPAAGLSDYLANPIENIVGLESLPPWDVYHGQVMDTEARLRLASLQAWLRRGPADGDLLARLAKAGQKFYDPYTGLPMLVNMKKAALYSVGHDGKDQDADPQFDVVVSIPAAQAHVSQSSTKPSVESSKP